MDDTSNIPESNRRGHQGPMRMWIGYQKDRPRHWFMLWAPTQEKAIRVAQETGRTVDAGSLHEVSGAGAVGFTVTGLVDLNGPILRTKTRRGMFYHEFSGANELMLDVLSKEPFDPAEQPLPTRHLCERHGAAREQRNNLLRALKARAEKSKL